MLIGVQGSGQWAEGSLDAGHFREIARAAEALGYDSLWAGDHLSFENPILDPAVALATFAAVTERITLGTGVLLLALRPPGIVAKQYATLDFLCGGRLIVGVGAGGDGPKDFEAAGVPLGERGTRTDEGIEALRALWAEGARASFHGRFSQFDDVRIEPPPARAGGPPIVVGGRVPAALARAGRLADGWLAYMVSTERLAGGLEVVRGTHAQPAAIPTACSPASCCPSLSMMTATRPVPTCAVTSRGATGATSRRTTSIATRLQATRGRFVPASPHTRRPAPSTSSSTLPARLRACSTTSS